MWLWALWPFLLQPCRDCSAGGCPALAKREGGSWDPPGRGSSGPPESVGRAGAPAALTWDGLRPADHCGPHPARPRSDSMDLMALSASCEWNQTGFVLLNCQLACFIRQNVLKIRPAGMLLPSFFL